MGFSGANLPLVWGMVKVIVYTLEPGKTLVASWWSFTILLGFLIINLHVPLVSTSVLAGPNLNLSLKKANLRDLFWGGLGQHPSFSKLVLTMTTPTPNARAACRSQVSGWKIFPEHFCDWNPSVSTFRAPPVFFFVNLWSEYPTRTKQFIVGFWILTDLSSFFFQFDESGFQFATEKLLTIFCSLAM